MNENATPPELPFNLARLQGEVVVLDVASRYVYVGTLSGGGTSSIELTEADVHDLRDTTTTREEYVLAAGRHGVTPNRRRVFVSLAEIVSVSALADVIG